LDDNLWPFVTGYRTGRLLKLRPANFSSPDHHASFGKDLSCIKLITGSISGFSLVIFLSTEIYIAA